MDVRDPPNVSYINKVTIVVRSQTNDTDKKNTDQTEMRRRNLLHGPGPRRLSSPEIMGKRCMSRSPGYPCQ